MSNDASSVRALDAEIRKGILAYNACQIVPLEGQKKTVDVPNKLRAYIFADRKSQSPEMAPSGVKHDIFVAFMTCLRYSRGSLLKLQSVNIHPKSTCATHSMLVVTLTRFSHSNSVHMLRNYKPNLSIRPTST